MELAQAATAFLKARYAVIGGLKEVTQENNEVVFHLDSTTHQVIIQESLKPVNASDKTTIATLNTKENVEFLANNWDDFLHPQLSILFMNPQTQEQWKVIPYSHNKIAEKKHLKKGLLSLSSQVTLV